MTDTLTRPEVDTETASPWAAIVPEGYGFLSIPDKSGDTRILWDPESKTEIAAAKAAFDQAKRDGMVAYSVDAEGNTGEVIREFPKKAGKVIMARQTQGG